MFNTEKVLSFVLKNTANLACVIHDIMEKSFSLFLIVSCLLGLPAGSVTAQKRYKHLKHARTPEGRYTVQEAHKNSPESTLIREMETLKPVTAEAFALKEPELMPPVPEPKLTVSAAEAAPEMIVPEVPSVQRLRKKAHHALVQSEKAFSAVPFAKDIVKNSGLEQLAPQKQQVNGLKFIIIGCIILGVALIFGIVGLALSIALALSGTFPKTLIFNYIGLLLFFAGAALLTVGIIFRIKEKRAAK